MSESSNTSKKSVTDADTSLKFAHKTLQDYEVISVIGNGNFGTCFKVRDKATGELYAWKGLDYDELSDTQKESLVSEISVLRQLQHPNIVQYYHHLVNHEAKSVFIVMECCEGGDLAQLIARTRLQRKRFEERYVWRVLFQICKALQLCHNKIKHGTILHRDIKPANIFLDAQGNAKLGDFGLARMLRRHESFAKSFVGTPYYMSPELVKGSPYDRKSDVWAVGCLAYEMCALRPPFRAREFEQLSAHIARGEFRNVSSVYSADLRDIIGYMLQVDKQQRPSIEVIIRHPTVVRNINDLGNEFPQLLVAEPDFEQALERDVRCKLLYSSVDLDVNSTACTEQHSFYEGYGQRRLSCAFTPDLRAELFYSAKRKISNKATLHSSDPVLYESIRMEQEQEHYVTVEEEPPAMRNPETLTEAIFNETLQQRLHAIRAQESLLEQKEINLNAREQQLNAQEKRLHQLEASLHRQQMELEAKQKLLQKQLSETSTSKSKPLPIATTAPPPIPPRKSSKHDDTYCSIDDTLQPSPTMAKINLAALPSSKSLSTLRRVTFQSPKKFIKYDIENAPSAPTKQSNAPMQASVSSGVSTDSADSQTHKRKSILSLFGLQRGNKQTNKLAPASAPAPAPAVPKPLESSEKPRMPFAPRAEQVLAKCETSELGHMWTKEHKRAAFELLAAMNAGQGTQQQQQQMQNISKQHKLRQSARDRHHQHQHQQAMRRNLLRRSVIVASAPQAYAANGGGRVGGQQQNREKIVV